jgi:hypothetical protein
MTMTRHATAAVTVMLLLGATTVFGQTPTASDKKEPTPSMSRAPAPDIKSDARSGETMGHHTMDGTVTRVDAKKGWIHLKTADGTLIMHFPPDALANVKNGDALTVDLALTDKGPAPSAKAERKMEKK